MRSQPASRAASAWARHRGWIGREVLAPFFLTRLSLVIISLIAQTLPRHEDYPFVEAAQRGWQFSPQLLLDAWVRWDAGWYLNIITRGYQTIGPFEGVQSNLHFLPLYPYLVKALLAVAPPLASTRDGVLSASLLVSNGMLLFALALLRQFVIERTGDGALARRSIWALLLFPTGFFLSAVYTESTYLCVTLAAWLLAGRRQWAGVFVFGALAGMARPVGVLMALPLSLDYLASIRWRWRAIGPGALAALGPVMGLLIFLVAQYPVTNNLLLPLNSEAFGIRFTWPWETWLAPRQPAPVWGVVAQIGVVVMAAACLRTWRVFRSPALTAQATLNAFASILTGSVTSYLRYALVAFPATVALAGIPARRAVLVGGAVLMAILQLLMFLDWCRFGTIL